MWHFSVNGSDISDESALGSSVGGGGGAGPTGAGPMMAGGGGGRQFRRKSWLEVRKFESINFPSLKIPFEHIKPIFPYKFIRAICTVFHWSNRAQPVQGLALALVAFSTIIIRFRSAQMMFAQIVQLDTVVFINIINNNNKFIKHCWNKGHLGKNFKNNHIIYP
jgi:hypothetical protein